MMMARTSVDRGSYDEFFRAFKASTLVERNNLKRIPVGSDYLYGMIEAPRLSLVDEIAWVAARLRSNSGEINEFLLSSSQLDAEIWGGRLEDALGRIEHIERQYGFSMWQLSLRIALEQQVGGIERQKEYVSGLRKTFIGTIIPYVAYYVSIRNESDVTWSWFVDDTKRKLEQSRLSRSLKTYFKWQFIKQWPNSETEAADILRSEQSHSDIDLYETFISLAQHVVSVQSKPDVTQAIIAALGNLSDVADPRLTKVEHYLGVRPFPAADVQRKAPGTLLRGKTPEAYRLAIRALRSDPTSIDHALVAAFARSVRLDRASTAQLAGLSPLWADVTLDLVRVFGRSSEYHDALDRLRKISCNFAATKPARALTGIVSSESSTAMLRPVSDLRIIGLNTERVTFCEAQAGVTVPGAEGCLASLFFASSHNGGATPDEVDPSARAYARAIAAARSQEWLGAADNAAEARSSRHMGLRRRAILFEAHARVRLEQVEPVVSLVEAELSSDGTLADLFPNVQLVDGKSWSDLREASSRLGLSIVLDLALKSSASDKVATHRRFAFDAFLKSQGVERASELDVHRYPRIAITYFLRNIAVFSVLDMSDALESTRDIQEERRRVLSLLIPLDPDEAVDYQDEILDITDQLSLAEGMRIVDSSRIHVDTDAIEAWANRELSDGYRRYRTLVDTGIGVADDFDLVLAKLRKGEENPKTLFAIPVNEADDLLISLTQQLLERFLYDPAHGLDSYLSRRIRHGSIVGFLRGPAEAARLVSLRDETDASYAPNQFWLEQLSDLKQEERDLISGYLIDFAKAYDDALIRLRDELIQIRDKDHPAGLIEMRLYADAFHLIRSAVKESSSFSVYVGNCFAAFWGLLDRHLGACREEITGRLRASLGSAFDELRGRVNQLYSGSTTQSTTGVPPYRRGLTELNGAITSAQNDLQAALEDVQTWFARSEVQHAKRIYGLEKAVNIAIQSARARLRSYKPEIDLSCEDGVGVPAEDLSVIAEIILVTLSNACEHSGVEGGAKVHIDVRTRGEGSQLGFSIRNPVHESKRTEQDLKLVDSIRVEIATSAATPAVRKDRRSGLRKLGALKMKFPVADLRFGFNDSHDFEVEIVVPFKSSRSATHISEEALDARGSS
ncbi:hypothetical protein ACIKT0_00050 [Hansschlegelia beijingensis]|uniref:hypothetical protein n=1 Tax=Hansschlegelia beijingensis TaxID=1133344 RepID=UPI00387EF403